MDPQWMNGMQCIYLVVPLVDLDRLTEEDRGTLHTVLDKIHQDKLEKDENTENRYLVVNVSKPHAEEVADVMKAHDDWGQEL